MVVVDEADRMPTWGSIPVVQQLLDPDPRVAPDAPLLGHARRRGSTAWCGATRRTRRVTCSLKLTRLRRRTCSGRPSATNVSPSAASIVSQAGPTIVFCRTKHGADALAKKFEQRGVSAARPSTATVHRVSASVPIASFADGKVTALVATDVAARGNPRRRRRLCGAFRPAGRLQGLQPTVRVVPARAGAAGTVVLARVARPEARRRSFPA